MISFRINDGRFNFRTAGILIRDNKVLIHKLIKDDFYAFPGGRVEMFETTEATIMREMKEELGIDIRISRLLWVAEHIFHLNQEKIHELCFYYLVECKENDLRDRGDCFTIVEGVNTFEFKWVDIKVIKTEILYPEFIKDRLEQLPLTVESVVEDK